MEPHCHLDEPDIDTYEKQNKQKAPLDVLECGHDSMSVLLVCASAFARVCVVVPAVRGMGWARRFLKVRCCLRPP